MKTEGSENVAMADPASLIIAYPPIKRIIKLEILEEQQEARDINLEDQTLSSARGVFDRSSAIS